MPDKNNALQFASGIIILFEIESLYLQGILGQMNQEHFSRLQKQVHVDNTTISESCPIFNLYSLNNKWNSLTVTHCWNGGGGQFQHTARGAIQSFISGGRKDKSEKSYQSCVLFVTKSKYFQPLVHGIISALLRWYGSH